MTISGILFSLPLIVVGRYGQAAANQRARFEQDLSEWANTSSAGSSRSMHIAQGALSRSERVCALIGRQYLALYGK